MSLSAPLRTATITPGSTLGNQGVAARAPRWMISRRSSPSTPPGSTSSRSSRTASPGTTREYSGSMRRRRSQASSNAVASPACAAAMASVVADAIACAAGGRSLSLIRGAGAMPGTLPPTVPGSGGTDSDGVSRPASRLRSRRRAGRSQRGRLRGSGLQSADVSRAPRTLMSDGHGDCPKGTPEPPRWPCRHRPGAP